MFLLNSQAASAADFNHHARLADPFLWRPAFPISPPVIPPGCSECLEFSFVHACTQHVIVTVGIYSTMRVFTRPHHAKNALNGDICRMSAVRQKNAKTGGSFTGGHNNIQISRTNKRRNERIHELFYVSIYESMNESMNEMMN